MFLHIVYAAGWRGVCRGGDGRRRGRCWAVAAGLNDHRPDGRVGVSAVAPGLTWLLGPGPGLTRAAGFSRSRQSPGMSLKAVLVPISPCPFRSGRHSMRSQGGGFTGCLAAPLTKPPNLINLNHGKNMSAAQSYVRTVSASSEEGKRLLANSNDCGEPLWRQKYYNLCKQNGAHSPPLPPPDENRYIMSLSESPRPK